MSSRLIPKKTHNWHRETTRHRRPATHASDRALTSALCGVLPSMPTLKVTSGLGCRCLCLRLMWTTSRNLRNRTRANNIRMRMVCCDFIQTGKKLARRCAADRRLCHSTIFRRHRISHRTSTDVVETASFKATIGVSRRPAIEGQPNKQMGVQTISSGRHMASCRRQAEGNLNRSMSEEQLRSLGEGARTDGEAEDAVYGWVRAQTGSE